MRSLRLCRHRERKCWWEGLFVLEMSA
jgi:hypothetical protein